MAASPPERPQYHFKVGEVLTYDFKLVISGIGYRDEIISKSSFWILKESKPGFWEGFSTNDQIRKREPAGEINPQPASEQKTFQIEKFTIDRNGRIETDVPNYVARIFAAFPDNDLPLPKAWIAPSGDGEETQIQNLGIEDGKMELQSELRGTMSDIYNTSRKTSSFFDLGTGRITSGKSTHTQGYSSESKGSSTFELKGIRQLSDADLDALLPAAERYFASLQKLGDLNGQLEKRPADAAQICDRIISLRKKIQSDLPMEPFHSALNQLGTDEDQMKARDLEKASKLTALLGKSAPKWTLPDTTGKTHSLKDYRGKVLVLDFWYRGCGWCIRAMPQMNELVDYFAGEPVVLLGINPYDDVADAEFVIKKMKLKYDTLLSHESSDVGDPVKMSKNYGASGFPLVVIIDKQGRIRYSKVGYSKNSKMELIAIIEGFLAE